MARYRKKPIVVDAIQFDGSNVDEIRTWIEQCYTGGKVPSLWLENAKTLIVSTLKGRGRASKSDWIICDVNGEFYPVEDKVFKAAYELVLIVKDQKRSNNDA